MILKALHPEDYFLTQNVIGKEFVPVEVDGEIIAYHPFNESSHYYYFVQKDNFPKFLPQLESQPAEEQKDPQ